MDLLTRNRKKRLSGWGATLMRKHPVLCVGVPFVSTLVVGSFALAHLTQTKVDYNSTRVQKVRSFGE
jgi:hypothetical protein